MYKAFKDMPVLLKFITMHSFASLVLFLDAIIPGIPLFINGEDLNPHELWSRGLGELQVVFGISMPLVGFLFLKRWHPARLVYILLISCVLVVFPYVHLQDFAITIFGVILTCIMIVYLFFNKKVNAYFRKTSNTGRSKEKQ